MMSELGIAFGGGMISVLGNGLNDWKIISAAESLVY